VLPKLRTATAASTRHSTDGALPTMIKLRLPKISSLDRVADFDSRNPGFACPEPRKNFPAAHFYPHTLTNFCHLDVQLF
jgi:hypothetical protein